MSIRDRIPDRPPTATRVIGAVMAAVLTIGLPLVAPTPAQGQTTPVDAIRDRNQAVQAILETVEEGDSVMGETRERLKDEINSLIDFSALSARALGRYWEERTEAEKAEFVDVFRELVRNSSVRKLGVHEADSVTYGEPVMDEADDVQVTTVVHKGDNAFEIVYHLHEQDGEWRAWDVVIDGSSTMRTYRDSFYREIRATSFQAMLDRLKERLAEEAANAA